MIEESVVNISLRMGNWKYIVPTSPERITRAEWVAVDKDIEGGFTLEPQLYNLKVDPSEQDDLAQKNPSLVKEMQSIIEDLKIKGFRE